MGVELIGGARLQLCRRCRCRVGVGALPICIVAASLRPRPSVSLPLLVVFLPQFHFISRTIAPLVF